MMRRHKEIVIGAGLSAVVYAYLNDCIVLGDTSLSPAPFDFLMPDVNLDPLNIENINYDLKGVKPLTVGAAKRDIWERLIYIKSLAGHIPMGSKLENIRVDIESGAVTAAGQGTSITFEYDKLRIFDDRHVRGIQDLALDFSDIELKHKVVDWLDVRSGCRHEYDYITSADDFVKEIYFYPSDRVHGNHDIKDAVAVSHLTERQMNMYEFSDTYARMKAAAHMKELGIRGTRNGRDTKNPEKFKYYALRLESAHREVYRSNELRYRSSDKIVFDCRSVEEILSTTPLINSYTNKLNQGLFIV